MSIDAVFSGVLVGSAVLFAASVVWWWAVRDHGGRTPGVVMAIALLAYVGGGIGGAAVRAGQSKPLADAEVQHPTLPEPGMSNGGPSEPAPPLEVVRQAPSAAVDAPPEPVADQAVAVEPTPAAAEPIPVAAAPTPVAPAPTEAAAEPTPAASQERSSSKPKAKKRPKVDREPTPAVPDEGESEATPADTAPTEEVAEPTEPKPSEPEPEKVEEPAPEDAQ